MAGTDRKRGLAAGGPAIVLVEPQLGENIGAAARAMMNCGLGDLRLVRPRDGWPNDKAVAAASGADAVLERARLFASAEEAIADLRRVYATTARHRGTIKRVATPRRAAAEIRKWTARDEPVGVLFGPERTGLRNEDIALADAVISVPLNPGFASLNLAQSVLILAYEWFQAGDATPPSRLITNETRPATKAELLNFFAHLEQQLDECGFLRNIRNLFQRAALTRQEVRTLHGVVAELSTLRQRSK